jgi:hypothetical protein
MQHFYEPSHFLYGPLNIMLVPLNFMLGQNNLNIKIARPLTLKLGQTELKLGQHQSTLKLTEPHPFHLLKLTNDRSIFTLIHFLALFIYF